MASKNSTSKSLNHKPSISGFKMFGISILRKDRMIEELEDPMPLLQSPTYEDGISNGGGYVARWNASPVVKPLRNQLVPREARITERVPNINAFSQPLKSATRGSKTSSNKSITEEQERENRGTDERSMMNDMAVTRTMDIRHRRLLEEMANNCSREPCDRKEWGYWFEAYTNGHFNMSNPPQTPPRDLSLLWIPTPFPADESERLRALDRYDLCQASSIESDLRTVLRAAATALNAEYASISLVDYESETFLLNHPIRIGTESKIKRACSLGAHVMLSNDTMVILDTRKDWRFKESPILRSGQERINFYAGSPLISPDGYNIGVLAISGNVPRSKFRKNELRSLNNFANVVSNHLERLLPESRRTLSMHENQMPSIGTESRESTASAPAAMEELSQNERRVRGAELNQKYNGFLTSNPPGPSQMVMAARLEAERSLTKATRSPRRCDYHHNGLPILPSLPIPPSTIEILPPRAPPTPPLSATAFGQKMPQRWYMAGAQTPTPPISPSTPRFPRSPRSPSNPFISLNLPLASFQPPQNLPQARDLLSEVAQEIDFDYLYIIRLEPISSALTYADLLNPSSFQVTVVRSYRRNPSPPGSANQALNTELHLKALGDRCGLTAVNSRKSGRGGDDSYQVSALLPVQRDYVDERGNVLSGPVCGDGWREDRNSGGEKGRVCRGHILGAYKRRNTGKYKEAIEKLEVVADQLGELMFETRA